MTARDPRVEIRRTALLIKVGWVVLGVTIAFAVLMAAAAIGSAATDGAGDGPVGPAFWTPLPQPASERTGVWTACTDGVRLFLAEGTPAAGPSITSQPDPRCES